MTYDEITVGGGPAGLFAAYHLMEHTGLREWYLTRDPIMDDLCNVIYDPAFFIRPRTDDDLTRKSNSLLSRLKPRRTRSLVL